MDTSAFVTYGNKTETKRVHFAGPDAPDKISRGSQSAIARDTSKFVALYQRNTKIRMRSEERNENNINNQWVASFTGPRVAFKKVELWENYHNHFSYSLEKNDLYHKL